jgi:thiamine pyrophosphokinase-like protein
MVLVLAAVATILVAMAVIPAGQIFLRYLSAQWDAVRYWLAGLL